MGRRPSNLLASAPANSNGCRFGWPHDGERRCSAHAGGRCCGTPRLRRLARPHLVCQRSCPSQLTEAPCRQRRLQMSSEQQKIVTVAGMRRRAKPAGREPPCWRRSRCMGWPMGATRYFIAGTSTAAACSASPAWSSREPFDVAGMAAEEFRGITLFAVLPGPVEPLQTFDELLAAARGLAQEFSGMVQDVEGDAAVAAACGGDARRCCALSGALVLSLPLVSAQKTAGEPKKAAARAACCGSCWIATTTAITHSMIPRCRTPNTIGSCWSCAHSRRSIRNC